MLLGARAIFSPSESLSFELLQTSQWGGENIKLNSSTVGALLFGNTNEGNHFEINKMAGFGFSYSKQINKNIFRIYGQAIGEDEAGYLPSCFIYMAGLELINSKIKAPTTLAIEFTDTRGDKITELFCGPNAAYNNNVYDYINYDTVMGVPIDSGSTSLELFGRTDLNKNFNLNYSTKIITINDQSHSTHRLSTKRSTGTVTSLGIHWKKDRFDIGGNISYQSITLDQANISNGTVFSLFTSVKF